MSSVNKIILIGRLGKDPEPFNASGGTKIVKFSVATDRPGAKTEGEKPKVDWHNVTTFGKLAETCERYLGKGRECYIEGRIEYNSYEKDGQTRYSTTIIADVVRFLGSPAERSSDSQPAQGRGQGTYTPPTAPPVDDDIPF